jgi:hypothetical protein
VPPARTKPLPTATRNPETTTESQLRPDSKRYPAIVDLLLRARVLYDKAGHRSEADAEILRLREAYRRRTALMAAMNRANLPS